MSPWGGTRNTTRGRKEETEKYSRKQLLLNGGAVHVHYSLAKRGNRKVFSHTTFMRTKSVILLLAQFKNCVIEMEIGGQKQSQMQIQLEMEMRGEESVLGESIFLQRLPKVRIQFRSLINHSLSTMPRNTFRGFQIMDTI